MARPRLAQQPAIATATDKRPDQRTLAWSRLPRGTPKPESRLLTTVLRAATSSPAGRRRPHTHRCAWRCRSRRSGRAVARWFPPRRPGTDRASGPARCITGSPIAASVSLDTLLRLRAPVSQGRVRRSNATDLSARIVMGGTVVMAVAASDAEATSQCPSAKHALRHPRGGGLRTSTSPWASTCTGRRHDGVAPVAPSGCGLPDQSSLPCATRIVRPRSCWRTVAKTPPGCRRDNTSR